MNIIWVEADGYSVASVDAGSEVYELRAMRSPEGFGWSVRSSDGSDFRTGSAPTLALAQRNAIGALMERLTGRRGRMVEPPLPLSVPPLPALQDAMWDLFASAGRSGGRQRESIDGWARLAHRALVRLAGHGA